MATAPSTKPPSRVHSQALLLVLQCSKAPLTSGPVHTFLPPSVYSAGPHWRLCTVGTWWRDFFFKKMWYTSSICMSSLCRAHANLLGTVSILVYVLLKRVLDLFLFGNGLTILFLVLGIMTDTAETTTICWINQWMNNRENYHINLG